ncbi:P-loop containing nucleoside triphosphate hydrolase protein [Kalaharituber pfeilii]|nr:P-loop containing nucleoside triphosphate hydrolase protein [Kalaharituber pfeilii]
MDKANCNELIDQLKEYIDGLFNVLPPASTPISVLQTQTIPKTRLSLSFNVPINISYVRRNPDFVGREYLLEQLAHEIGEGRAAMDITQVVLHGMGGMGKTQIALEYVYHHRKDYSSAFWINAASEQTTKTSFIQIMEQLIEHHASLLDEPDYKHIGNLLGMAGKLDSAGLFSTEKPEEEQHVIKAVKKWLTAKQNNKWLLVFDNLDDLESFDINDYIPSCDFGTIIITSRRRESMQGRRGLEVYQMQNNEAEKLLLTSARLDLEKLAPEERKLEEAAAVVAIVQNLGYLPLAIAQAGAYISVQQCLFSHYLREYKTNFNHLLSRKWKVGKDDRSVFATWELSFNAIKNQNPKAAKLLSLCAFLDNNDICEDFLRRGMNLATNDTSLTDSIHLLFSYSIAKRTETYDSFNIHPLVHLCILWKLEMEPDEYQKYAIEAFLMVASGIAVPEGRNREVSDWIFERRNLPHLFAAERQMKYLPLEKEESLAAVDTFLRAHKDHGHYGKAEEMCTALLVANEKLLGTNHSKTLGTIHDMAGVYLDQGKYNQALELYQRALAGYEKSLGADHPSTLDTVGNMAIVYQKQGKYSQALQLYQRALAGYEKSLGADHPSALQTVQNMAIVYDIQGKYSQALELYQRALAGYEKSLGADHPSTLDTVQNMAIVYQNQGKYSQALELYQRALAGYEKSLGADHPSTLRTAHNMAIVYEKQGKYSQALELYQRALAGCEKSLGADHPSTLRTAHNMAIVYEKQGKYSQALELYQRALAGYEKSLDADHLSTLYTVNNIAIVYKNQGKYSQALELYQRALAGKEKSLGADHPSTLRTVHNMAVLYENQEKYSQAVELYQRAFAGREKALGADHPDTLESLKGVENCQATLKLTQ